MPAPSPLSVLLAQIREVLYSSGRHIMSQAQPLIEQAYTLLDMEDPDDPATALHASDLAHSLLQMLGQTLDKAFVAFGLGVLIHLGPMGEILAVSFLRQTELAQQGLKAILHRFPPHKLLHLANRILLNPKDNPSWLTSWAYDLIQQAVKDDPEDVLLFLEGLKERSLNLANPMQRELMRSRFGVWLTQLLKLQLSADQVRYMALTSSMLHSHALTVNLLTHLHKADAETLPQLLTIIGEHARKGHAPLSKAVTNELKHRDLRVRAAALAALVNMRAPTRVKALSYVHQRMPVLHPVLFSLLCRLDEPDLRAFLATIAPEDQPDVLQRLTALHAAVDPDWMFQALDKKRPLDAEGNPIGEHVVAALKRFILAQSKLLEEPRFRLDPAAFGHELEEKDAQDPGFLAQMKRGLEAIQAKVQNKVDSVPKDLAQPEVSGKALERLNLPDAELSGQVLTEVKWTNVNLPRLKASKMRFTRCRFRQVTFDGARFRDVSFEECEFIDCRLAGAGLRKVSLTNCQARQTQFLAMAASAVSMEQCSFTDCSFSGARLSNWELAACLFVACHFSHALVLSSRMTGAQWRDCHMDKGFMKDVTILDCETLATAMPHMRMTGLHTDEPLFLGQDIAARSAALDETTQSWKPTPAPPELGSAEGVALMRGLLLRRHFESDVKVRKQIYLENNRRRLDWAACMLGPSRESILRLLPLLVESPDPRWAGPPACSIRGYAPTFETLRMARETLKSEDFPTHKGAGLDRETPLPVQALSVIGSTGTIAQAQSSDVDLWLCHDQPDMGPAEIKALERKLERIEAWAAKALDLEVHFFVMDRRSIEDNKFGYSDMESAGSSQALLLKEEFYRTSMHLAGKKPAWWYFPPRLDQDQYARCLKRLSIAVDVHPQETINLGNLEVIPREEFFGASLWQIVKAIKSPFKSIMKFALLDKYIAGHNVDMLLSNRIKENLFAGERDLWAIDPYAVLFREVFNYYRERGMQDAQHLMRLSFLQKTGLHVAAQSTGRFFEMQGYSWMEYFFPYSEADIAAHVESQPGDDASSLLPKSFKEVTALGEQVVDFLLKTYQQVQEQLRHADKDLLVTSEDLTRLGRRIFSYLHPKKDKIMRLPFLDTQGRGIAGLEFSSQGVTGTPQTYIVSGAMADAKGKPRETEELTRDKSLERLLMWCVANSLYTPHTHVQGGQTLAYPVSITDISDLLQLMAQFMPPHEVFDTDLNENLRPERIVRVLVSVNMRVPREEPRILTASCLLATNWGELFCKEFTTDMDKLAKNPREFLGAKLELPLADDAKLMGFQPRKAVCPRIKFV